MDAYVGGAGWQWQGGVMVSYFATTTALKLCWCSCGRCGTSSTYLTFCDSLTNTYHWLYGGIQIGH